MAIVTFVLGILIGIIMMAIIKAGKIAELEGLVNARTIALERAEDKITERTKFIKGQKEYIKDLTNKITDLENSVDYLFNNLSAQKKKLIRPDNQN